MSIDGTDRSPGRHRARLDWRAQAAGFFLGALGGIAVNLAGNGGVPVLAGVASLACVLAVANWLRALPARAPLARAGTRTLLGLAATAALTVLIAPHTWTISTTLTAAALLTTAVLTATTLDTAAQLLSGAATVGVGIAMIGVGVGVVLRGAAHCWAWLSSAVALRASEAEWDSCARATAC